MFLTGSYKFCITKNVLFKLSAEESYQNVFSGQLKLAHCKKICSTKFLPKKFPTIQQITKRTQASTYFQLGLAKPPRIPIPLIQKTSGDFTEYYGDGVMGLGFADSNSKLPFTLFQLITNIGLEMAGYSFHVDELVSCGKKLFGIFLFRFKHTAANGFTDKGYGIYGGVDTDGGKAYGFNTKKCDANVVYHKISKRRQWTLKVDK
jgi:hypothetical protein